MFFLGGVRIKSKYLAYITQVVEKMVGPIIVCVRRIAANSKSQLIYLQLHGGYKIYFWFSHTDYA